MLVKILIAVAVLIVIFIAVVASRPDHFRYERSMTIDAPASAIFPWVNNQRKWEDWSPWAKLDPNMKQEFSGPDEGVGSSYTWQGNNEVGEGTSTITESRPVELVRFKLEFRKPMEGVNTVDFTFKAEGDKTVVTWAMYGPNNFVGKAFGLFVDCEKMCGDMFTQGLGSLKKIVETKS